MLNYTKRYLLKNNLYKSFVQQLDKRFIGLAIGRKYPNICLMDNKDDLLNALFDIIEIDEFSSPILYAFPWFGSNEGYRFWREQNGHLIDFKKKIKSSKHNA